jgi:hypothetical protein
MDFNNFFDLNKPEDQFRLAANCLLLFLSLLEIFKKLEEKSIRKE